VAAPELAELVNRIADGTISNNAAKTVLQVPLATNADRVGERQRGIGRCRSSDCGAGV